MNYQQGTLYENIEDFSYVSYRPTTDFGLSGLRDGTSTVTATHRLTGMRDSLDVRVETLQDKLYLFQCYPQAETKLTYTNGAGEEKTVTSDSTGAAAVYEASGIASDVYCSAVQDGITYLDTFYLASLKTGEGDWTRLERYPCNNLQLRRAAYAYLYVKRPDGTPYTGSITFRGGVYMNGEYCPSANFGFGGSVVSHRGDQGSSVPLGADGKLTVLMDQTQWGLPGNEIEGDTQISYVFEIAHSGTDYYPIFTHIDAGISQGAFISDGSAIINFRDNAGTGKHPFVISQTAVNGENGRLRNIMDSTGYVGPSDDFPEISLTTEVMWWGEDMNGAAPNLQLVTAGGAAVADGAGEWEISHTAYPFSTDMLTTYTVRLDEASLRGSIAAGEVKSLALDYCRDGAVKSRHEDLPFHLYNMLGLGKVDENAPLKGALKNMGRAMGTDASAGANG